MTINIEINADFKAIKNFQPWTNISGLNVLTGFNGSGKTQLLDLIYNAIEPDGAKSKADTKIASKNMKITGETIKPSEIIYLPVNHRLGGAPIVHLNNYYNQLNQIHKDLTKSQQTFFATNNRKKYLRPIFSSVIEQNKLSLSTLTVEDLEEHLPEEWLIYDFEGTYDGIANLLRKSVAELEQKVISEELTIKEAKIKWENDSIYSQLKDLLSTTSLGFTITSCWALKSTSPYKFLFIKPDGTEVTPNDLSTGEAAITKLIMLTFLHAQNIGRPKLILLDEQDAHLEPSAIDEYIRTIQNVLVEKYGSTVIMTTHRSETIALTPPNCLFELTKSPSAVIPVTANKTISRISGNLLKIWTDGQMVLVEADDDQKFHSDSYKQASNIDEQIKQKRLSFISVATNKRSGGCSVVESHVAKMNGFAKGLLDGDNNPKNIPHITQLFRYSIENYYLDPPILLSILTSIGKLPSTSEVNFSVTPNGANLGEISSLPEDELQVFSNWLYQKVKNAVPTSKIIGSDSLIECVYSNNKKLHIPEWVFKTKGHDLIQPFRNALSIGILTMDNLRLHRGFQISMMPIDLLQTFKNL